MWQWPACTWDNFLMTACLRNCMSPQTKIHGKFSLLNVHLSLNQIKQIKIQYENVMEQFSLSSAFKAVRYCRSSVYFESKYYRGVLWFNADGNHFLFFEQWIFSQFGHSFLKCVFRVWARAFVCCGLTQTGGLHVCNEQSQFLSTRCDAPCGAANTVLNLCKNAPMTPVSVCVCVYMCSYANLCASVASCVNLFLVFKQ